jgi:hypothetical protein
MTQAQESRPGDQTKAAVDLEDSNILPARTDKHSDAVLALTGVFVLVVTSKTGRTRRHIYFQMASAQAAVDRSTAKGSRASIVLCQLLPVGGAL